jgi:hypothetical protein
MFRWNLSSLLHTELQGLGAVVIFFQLLCGLRSMLLNIHSVNLLQYYEMSPYEDSDEEGTNDLELKREIRRSRRLIPSWAQ